MASATNGDAFGLTNRHYNSRVIPVWLQVRPTSHSESEARPFRLSAEFGSRRRIYRLRDHPISVGSKAEIWVQSQCALSHRKRPCAVHPPMSTLGQKQTFAPQNVMSALLTKADMCDATRDVRYGPIADISPCSIISFAQAMRVSLW